MRNVPRYGQATPKPATDGPSTSCDPDGAQVRVQEHHAGLAVPQAWRSQPQRAKNYHAPNEEDVRSSVARNDNTPSSSRLLRLVYAAKRATRYSPPARVWSVPDSALG